MKRLFWLWMGLWILTGCGSKQYYMLSTPHTITAPSYQIAAKIGIESIEVPAYLQEGKIAVQRSDNRIVYHDDALWAVDMQEDLTNALIFDLQKSLPKSRVFHYPWEGEGQADVIVSVKIKRFIAYKGVVYLDAVIRIGGHDRVVSIQEPTDMHDRTKIIESMKKAFFSLEREVLQLLTTVEPKSL